MPCKVSLMACKASLMACHLWWLAKFIETCSIFPKIYMCFHARPFFRMGLSERRSHPEQKNEIQVVLGRGGVHPDQNVKQTRKSLKWIGFNWIFAWFFPTTHRSVGSRFECIPCSFFSFFSSSFSPPLLSSHLISSHLISSAHHLIISSSHHISSHLISSSHHLIISWSPHHIVSSVDSSSVSLPHTEAHSKLNFCEPKISLHGIIACATFSYIKAWNRWQLHSCITSYWGYL